MQTVTYAVDGPTDKFHPWIIERREVGPNDVLIKIKYCGICHRYIIIINYIFTYCYLFRINQ